MKDLFNNKKPVQIEIGEWWFNGCIIQEQIHPMLMPYITWKDKDGISNLVNTHSTFKEAIQHVLKNGCDSPDRFPKNYL